jgi:branched-chain amino acid transport system permease protein
VSPPPAVLGSRLARWAAPLALLAVAPLLVGPYATLALTRLLVFALLALGLDLLAGYAGLASLGHGAYFGAGAYAAGWVALHVSPSAPLMLLASLGTAAFVAAVAGSLAVRAHGVFFLMLTLALGEIVQQLAESWHGVTGGSNGLYGIPAARLGAVVLLDARDVYWWVLGMCALCALGFASLAASPFGDTLRGIRDNEPRMRALGYRVYHYKLAAFVASGAGAGLAGGLLATQQRLVTPADAGLGTSIPALLALTIGGAGSLWGACVGAAIVVLVRDWLGVSLGGRGPLILGLTFVAVVYLLPGGLAGAVRRGQRA